MEVKVIKEACIGCGACASIAPDFFEMNDEGIAITTGNYENLSEDSKKEVMDGKDSCPTDAIVAE